MIHQTDQFFFSEGFKQGFQQAKEMAEKIANDCTIDGDYEGDLTSREQMQKSLDHEYNLACWEIALQIKKMQYDLDSVQQIR